MASPAQSPIPNSTAPLSPPQPLTQKEQQTIIPANQEWTDSYAKTIAVQDFQRAENYRNQNHDRRFKESDRLLTGFTERKFWEGTRVPRSAVPVFIMMQEVEVLQSRLISAIFSDDPAFAVTPEPTGNLAQAFAVKNLIASQLRDIGKPGQFLTMRELCRRANKSALTYGAGPIEFGWHMQDIDRTYYDRVAVAETQTIQHPQFGEVQVPTGNLKFQIVQRNEKRQISKPVFQNVDVRDFYVDPNCISPNPQDGSFGATRGLLTIADLLDYGKLPGFKIPSDKTLLELAHQKSISIGDASKQQAEGYRGNNYQPTVDQSTEPSLQRVEVIRYHQKLRTVWILGRQHVALNIPNPYGILPYLNQFYIDFLGRFYGFSISDLVEGDHKLAMAIINARIDELNLLIHSPIVRRKGSSIVSGPRRMHPGAQWEVSGNPKEDIIRMEMGSVNPGAYAEVQALELRTAKLTGNTDQAAFGVATSGGDSSSRTATGNKVKAAATNVRDQYIIENTEDQFIEPMLYVLLALNKRYINPLQLQQILGPQGQLIQLDPLDVLNADVRFEMQAGTKMKAKNNLSSGGLQEILQFYLNPAMVQLWQQGQMTVDMSAIDSLVTDSIGLPQRSLLRQMTPQEIQAAQQPPAAEVIRLQMQQDRLQAQAQNQDSGDETKLLLMLLQKLITPDTAHRILQMPYPAQIQAQAQPKQLTNGK